MTTEQLAHLNRLLRLVSDFESAAHLDIDIVLKTNGRVKLLIRDPESEQQQTRTFASIAEANDWVQEKA